MHIDPAALTVFWIAIGVVILFALMVSRRRPRRPDVSPTEQDTSHMAGRTREDALRRANSIDRKDHWR